MRRHWRRLFDLFTAAALCLCVLSVILWIRSEWVWDEWNFLEARVGGGQTFVIRLTVTSVNGGLGVKIPSTDAYTVSAGNGPPPGRVWHQRSSGRPQPTAYPN